MNDFKCEFEITDDMTGDRYEFMVNSAIHKLIESYLAKMDVYDTNIAFKLQHKRYKRGSDGMYEKIQLIPYDPTINLYNSKKYTFKERIKILFKGQL